MAGVIPRFFKQIGDSEMEGFSIICVYGIGWLAALIFQGWCFMCFTSLFSGRRD